MNQLDMSNFEVAPGETVTIEITAIKVGELVTLALDGQSISSSSTGPKCFNITASTTIGTRHFGRLGFTFPPATPPDASYKYIVSGSQGGSFTGRDVLTDELIPTRTVNLIVK
jgi:hypothetical protein